MRALLAAALLAFVLAPVANALPAPPPEVLVEAAKLDGTPFELELDATTLPALQAFNASISGLRIHDCVQAITTSGTDNYRVMGTPVHDQFVTAYANVFGELGLATARQDFAKGGPGVGVTVPTGGTNILGVLPGRHLDRWVVVGGHYDTRELTAGGGALDNTSGICTVLEIARQAKAYVNAGGTLEASMVFAWYDGEEWGLYGAIAFAEDPSVAKDLLKVPAGANVTVLVSQSFDMPGLNYPAKNNWVQYGDPTVTDELAVLNLRTAPIHRDEEWTCWSYGCYEDLKDRADFEQVWKRDANYQFLVREVAYDMMRLPPEAVWVYDDHYGRSDHIPLIAKGAAGMRIQGSHDEEYPHYHQPTDTLPALYELTGSKEALVAGYETEARVGGDVAFYVAREGFTGHYGYVYDPSLGPVVLTASAAPGPSTQGTPLPFLLAPAALALALWRKR